MLSLSLGQAPAPPSWLAPIEREGIRHAREPLLRTLLAEPPQRILNVCADKADHLGLSVAFPDASCRAGELSSVSGQRPAWAGWPDLVWCPHLLSDRRVDPAVALASIWRGLQPGGRIAVVDLLAVECQGTRRFLEGRLGRRIDRRLLDALLTVFRPIRADIVEHPGGLSSLVFVGRRTAAPQ